MDTAGRESVGDKPEGFDGDVFGEGEINIGSAVLPFLSKTDRAFLL